jgi:hypothetical protein
MLCIATQQGHVSACPALEKRYLPLQVRTVTTPTVLFLIVYNQHINGKISNNDTVKHSGRRRAASEHTPATWTKQLENERWPPTTVNKVAERTPYEIFHLRF